HRFEEIIKTVKGAQDIYVETVTGLPQIVVKLNRIKMAQYNLNVSEINSIVNTAFAGQSAGKVYEGEKQFEVILRLDENQRGSVKDIQNLLIPTSTGMQIPLYEVAEVSIIDGPAQIQREDSKRRI